MKVTCIDFETANASRASACSVGIAVFQDGKLVETSEKLIKPHVSCCYFDPRNIFIHGIHARDVANAPEFGELSDWLFPQLDADLVVAHNAAFDMSVLRADCDLYHLNYPELRYFCTCKAAAHVWPGLENHKLDTLCNYIGHQFKHHDAEADAEAAGLVLNAMLNESNRDSPLALAESLNMKLGELHYNSYQPCSCRKNCSKKHQPEKKG